MIRGTSCCKFLGWAFTAQQLRGAQHLWHCLFFFNCPRETGLILRCAGKAGNPFQTTQGNRLSCRDQEGRRGSEEAVPGASVVPSGDPGVSGTGSIPGPGRSRRPRNN